MKFSTKSLFSKCGQIRRVTFTNEILNEKFHFLCSVTMWLFKRKDEPCELRINPSTNLGVGGRGWYV